MNKFGIWMEKHGIKQYAAAREMDMATTVLHQILHKGQKPSIRNAYKIEKYTNGVVTLYDWIDDDLIDDTYA